MTAGRTDELPGDLAGARARVGAEQRALVAALVAGAPPPEGFDADRVAVAAAALRRKRTREAAEAWPDLARCLGPTFAPRFDAWARTHPMPRRWTSPWADGLAFGCGAVPTRELDADALAERLVGRARAIVSGGRRPRVRARRGPVLLWGLGRAGGRTLTAVVGPSPRRIQVFTAGG